MKITSEELAAEMERFAPEEPDIDKLFGPRVSIGLANQRKKKRPGTSSKYKGVRRDKSRWRSEIGYKERRINLGSFDKEVDAARAYDDAARKIYGELAATNFPKTED